MIRTGRFTLGVEPQRVDLADDDERMGRNLTVIAQGAGTIVVCEDANGYDTGARVPVGAGSSIGFDPTVGREDIWLASPEPLDVDVFQSGVS